MRAGATGWRSSSHPPFAHCFQAALTTLIIDVKEAVVHNNCVGVLYHILCGRTNRQVGEVRRSSRRHRHLAPAAAAVGGRPSWLSP